jgi:hypothetical protein
MQAAKSAITSQVGVLTRFFSVMARDYSCFKTALASLVNAKRFLRVSAPPW